MISCHVAPFARRLWPMALLAGCALPRYADEPPERPVTLAPEAGARLVSGDIQRFSWRAVPDADRYEFHVFDRSSGEIERHYLRALRSDDTCRIEDGTPAPVCAVELAPRLPVLEGHAWRVRAGNMAGWSGWTRDLFSLVER